MKIRVFLVVSVPFICPQISLKTDRESCQTSLPFWQGGIYAHPACRSSGTLKPKRRGTALFGTGLCEGERSIPDTIFLTLPEVTEPCSTSAKKHYYNDAGKRWLLFSMFSYPTTKWQDKHMLAWEQQTAQFAACVLRDLLSKTPQLFPSRKMMLGILAWG